VAEALKAQEELKKQGIDIRVIDIHTIKPIDKEIIIKAAKETKKIITIEDHSIIGGLGSAVCEVLSEEYPDYEYNCIRYSPKTGDVSFQESPDFDTAREPKVGDYITVKPDGTIKTGHSEYIFHHKWLWVLNDYSGFDVAESWDWSRQWLNTLQETSDGNGIGRWNAQLQRYGLPLDR
jgi:hypothetical protein